MKLWLLQAPFRTPQSPHSQCEARNHLILQLLNLPWGECSLPHAQCWVACIMTPYSKSNLLRIQCETSILLRTQRSVVTLLDVQHEVEVPQDVQHGLVAPQDAQCGIEDYLVIQCWGSCSLQHGSSWFCGLFFFLLLLLSPLDHLQPLFVHLKTIILDPLQRMSLTIYFETHCELLIVGVDVSQVK